jgi:chitinase
MLSVTFNLRSLAIVAQSISHNSGGLEDHNVHSSTPVIHSTFTARDTAPPSLAPDLMASETFFSLPPHDAVASPLVMAYYPDWVSGSFPPERIDFTRFHWIDFAFALPTEKQTITWDNPQQAPDILSRLVELAHKYGCKVKVSVGGWTGSK